MDVQTIIKYSKQDSRFVLFSSKIQQLLKSPVTPEDFEHVFDSVEWNADRSICKCAFPHTVLNYIACKVENGRIVQHEFK